MAWLAGTLVALIFALSGASQAAGGNDTSAADLVPIIELIENEDYQSAIKALFERLDVDPDNADILALLGFSHRKIGKFDDALSFYRMALRVDPRHLDASEHLAELYLATDRFDKALRQLEILDALCSSGCSENSLPKRAIDAYREASPGSS